MVLLFLFSYKIQQRKAESRKKRLLDVLEECGIGRLKHFHDVRSNPRERKTWYEENTDIGTARKEIWRTKEGTNEEREAGKHKMRKR